VMPNAIGGVQFTQHLFSIANRLRWPHDWIAWNIENMHKNRPVELGKRGGKVGGPARAKKLTPEQRSESARKAANARWSKGGS
jgi:hypothetical protein